MKWAYLKYLIPCLPRALVLGRRAKSFTILKKPNPLRDGDGKPRILLHLAGSSFSVFPALT